MKAFVAIAMGVLILALVGCESTRPNEKTAWQIYQESEKAAEVQAKAEETPADVLGVDVYPGAVPPQGLAGIVRVDGLANGTFETSASVSEVVGFYRKALKNGQGRMRPTGTTLRGKNRRDEPTAITIAPEKGKTRISIVLLPAGTELDPEPEEKPAPPAEPEEPTPGTLPIQGA